MLETDGAKKAQRLEVLETTAAAVSEKQPQEEVEVKRPSDAADEGQSAMETMEAVEAAAAAVRLDRPTVASVDRLASA